MPLFALAIYTGGLIHAGNERTDRLLELAAELEDYGLRPSDLPASWLQGLLTVEDPGFYDHHGVDLSTPGAGLTTITQALVKIHYFEQFRPGIAKYKQSVLAVVLDKRLTKEQQLALFLNTAGFGHVNGQKVAGFVSAADVYYSKSFHQLSKGEFLSLVAMLVGPNEYNLSQKPSKNAERVSRIEALLAGECAATRVSDVYYQDCS